MTAFASLAVRGAHVLIVEAPGAWRIRVELERAAARRGWRAALSPADADVLVVCGTPGAGLAPVVDHLWGQLPGPRARVDCVAAVDAESSLDAASRFLADARFQQEDAMARPLRQSLDDRPSPGGAGHSPPGHAGMDHADMDHGAMGHDTMDHGANGHADTDHGAMGRMDHDAAGHDTMDHSTMDHSTMDHGTMDMAPGGIPLATGAEDRDGLQLDEQRMQFGPVLPHWPAGLVLHCTLQGDAITAARAELLDADTPTPPPAEDAARYCDSAAQLLSLAGWDDGASAARRTRDLILDGADGNQAEKALHALERRIRRSWLLRWSLRDLGRVDDGLASRLNLPGWMAGDVFDRLVALVLLARDGAREEPAQPAASRVLGALPGLVTGLDVAAARLVVASVALDAARSPAGVGHG